ncbi:MAG: energy transducer TonB [Acidobacteriota bacterium]
MMEFRGNILLSALVHATIFVMALTMMAGRDAVSRVPEKYTAVTLFEEAAGQKPETGTDKKKDLPGRTVKTATRLREGVPSEVPLRAPVQKEAAASLEKNSPPQDVAGPAEAGTVGKSGPSASDQREGGESPGTSPGAMQLAIPGKASTQAGLEGGKSKTASGDPGAVNTIRAAIERAKRYPPLARRRGLEGTVTAEFTISARGYPENIRIVRSSGHEILDSAAKKTILRASPFPAVKGILEVPITFRIAK